MAMTAPAKLSPQLHSGDRLTRAEFHRRYKLHPEIRKAELIEGVVFVASPLSAERHGDPHADIMGWLFLYRRRHPELKASDNATVLLDADNEVQPDAVLRRVEGGTSQLTSRGFIQGPPELIIEVAASSVSNDLHDKMNVYRCNGVREYVVWRVDDKAVDWFQLVDGAYVRVEPDADGVIESVQFPGLRLDTRALLAGDIDGVAKAIER